MLWGEGPDCTQGATALVEFRRCDGEWRSAVHREMRAGGLSEDTHAFLHGLPTSVGATHLTGQKASCVGQGVTAYLHRKDFLARKECTVCREERRVRQVVATDFTARRL